MTIHYKPLNQNFLSPSPVLIISDVDNRGENTLVIKISGIECNHAFVGGKKYRVANGHAEINLRDLEDGINEVTFISGTKKLDASPFFKAASAVERVPLDSAMVKSLENLLTALFERLGNADARISVLEEKIIPKSILTFE